MNEAPPVQYARTSDGYNIAYTIAGEGTPFLLTPPGMSHVQLEWRLQNTSPWFAGLSQRFRLVHFDGRGQGMSDRGLGPNFSHEDRLRDLTAVVEKLRLHSFVLMGIGHTAHTAVRYASHHPQLVEALVLLNTAVSLKPSAVSLQIDLARHDWSLFLNSLAAGGRLPPDVQESVLHAFHEMTLPGDWLVALAAFAKSDITDVLTKLTLPTLVLHSKDYLHYSAADVSRVASLIPNARLITLDGTDLFGPATQGLEAIDAFLSDLDSTPRQDAVSVSRNDIPLSRREVEVLRLVASGRNNQQIAEALVISPSTVAKHVSNILTKIDAGNRVEATSYAHRHHLV